MKTSNWFPSVRLLGIAVLAAAMPVAASTNAPSSSGSSSSAYIEQPQSATSVTTYSPSYSPSYYTSDYYGTPYYGGHYFGGTYHTTTIFPRRYFFPPRAPALGDAYLKNRTKSASTSRSTIPLGLSEYLNEPFYAPLSPFLYDENLSKKRQKMIDDYRTAKLALVAELQAKITSVQSLDAAGRESALADFARQQTPRVIQIEQTGYAIRDELTQWKLFKDTSDWNEGREWRLGDNTRWESTMDEAKVMRGASYFQEGLSPAQRRLLREYAMELDDSGRPPTTEVGLDSSGPYFYFSPETSRIRLPGNIPAELQAKISSYTQMKAALKKELRDVLYREDRRWFNSSRAAALRALAEKQAGQLAALDPLAEEIRRGLAPLPNPARPRGISQSLPQPLGGRVATFMERKAEYQRVMNDKLAELRSQFSTSRVEFVKMGEGFGILLTPYRKLDDADKSRAEAAIQALNAFNDQQVRTYAELVREKLSIRDELVKSAGGLGAAMTNRIVDIVLREYGTTLALEELWRQYRDYEIAVLQPGLSPEQRRMLYDYALVKLDPQLPHYTY